MKLASRIRILFFLALAVLVAVTVVDYLVLSKAHFQQLRGEAQARLDGLLQKQAPEFMQELVNERFFAVRLRTETIQQQYGSDNIDIGLYRTDGAIISETKGMAALRGEESPLQLIVSHADENETVVKYQWLTFGRDRIGLLTVAKGVENSSGLLLKKATYYIVGIQILAFLLIMAVTQFTLQRTILNPLRRILLAIPNIAPFVNGQRRDLDLPRSLGLSELDEVSTALSDTVVRLKDVIQKEQKTRVEAERNGAIALTTQMLAHDVRKPLSILKTGMEMLGRARDVTAINAILVNLTPEIDKAVTSVDGLIVDIMEIGSPDSALILEAKSPESLIKSSLTEMLRVYPNADIPFLYDLNHEHMVNVHGNKISRVFSNVIANAFQTMTFQGTICFKTQEKDGFVEFRIANSGKPISEQYLPHLFDAFFTVGKKSGTGLGLAIAKKVVSAHGGKIWCESSIAGQGENKVEFIFTLPIAEERCPKGTIQLPNRCADIPLDLNRLVEHSNDVQDSASRPEVIIIEDNLILLEAWAAKLSNQVTQHLFFSFEELEEKISSDPTLVNRAAYVITDYYFDNSSKNGADIGRYLKAMRGDLTVFLSSDGYFAGKDFNRSFPRNWRSKRLNALGAEALAMS